MEDKKNYKVIYNSQVLNVSALSKHKEQEMVRTESF
jgi:hypothetical protein